LLDGKDAEGWVPLYYQGGATIGKAKVESVDGDGVHILMEINEGNAISELLSESLVGFSTVVLDADRAEDVINKTKEKTDE